MNWGGFPAAHGPICVIRPWLYQAFLSTKTRLSVENEDTGEECLALCLTIEAGCEVDDNDWLHAISSSQLPPNSSDHSSSPALISPARHQHRSSVNVRNTASRGRHPYTGTGEVSHLVLESNLTSYFTCLQQDCELDWQTIKMPAALLGGSVTEISAETVAAEVCPATGPSGANDGYLQLLVL